MSLFQLEKIVLHNGKTSQFKIECDFLSPKTKEDWECLAYKGSRIVGPFSRVVGVPRGGLLFAIAMEKYKTKGWPTLVVDDVLTTGASIVQMMKWHGDITRVAGLVVFARGPCPEGVKAVWQMHPDAEDAE